MAVAADEAVGAVVVDVEGVVAVATSIKEMRFSARDRSMLAI